MQTPAPVLLSDYAKPTYRIMSADLTFALDPRCTRVRAKLQIEKTEDKESTCDLVLDGEKLKLIQLRLDDRRLSPDDYVATETSLTIPSPPKSFTLESEVEISPEGNTALEGLYLSNGVYCTQCEPEGFRRITYFLDRPDVMSVIRTTIIAPKREFPVLLSNGNPVDRGELEDGLHFATWYDPFPKPSYLFALVAGDLGSIEDKYVTQSGRNVKLNIYVEKGNESRALYAMDALKRAIRWEEDTYIREYDLDVFNIVAVSDFNMGAMENKGLNIFNDRFILADPETATDTDYYLIESIIAHEYFHNWSGNRVTCRDWFQLSLKEGLTVFRDQEFTADMRDPANKRIDDVNLLRVSQFVEDAGPFAHPVRPDRYMEINNFYTATVYQKGAEVIRMMKTILGNDVFLKGVDLYFTRHDGQAVTCDDFVAALEDASGVDLKQFKRWYSQAGTPHVDVEGVFDAKASTYTLKLRQQCKSTPGQPTKEPFHIPIAIGLIDERGRDIPLSIHNGEMANTLVLQLTNTSQTFVFNGIKSEKPRLSFNRGFSAPINHTLRQLPSDQAFLMKHDSDAFNRWAAGQEYSTGVILQVLDSISRGKEVKLDQDFLVALDSIAHDSDLNEAFKASLLTLPSEEIISARMMPEDPLNLYKARFLTRRYVAVNLEGVFRALLPELETKLYVPNASGMGRRMLKRVVLSYLAATESTKHLKFIKELYDNASNMTEKMDALSILNITDTEYRTAALEDFYNKFKDNHLVVNKWLSLHACAPLPGTLSKIEQLICHPLFDIRNPNKVRALIGTFASLNTMNFHALDGSGYAFLADQILKIDAFNPQSAARLVAPLSRWKRHNPERRVQMKSQLERVYNTHQLSTDVHEMVKRSLDG